jgi:ribosomal protein S6
MEDKHEDRMTVYEIGYLIASSVPEEKIGVEADAVKKIISDSGASIISEGAPERQDLAYTIRRKTVGGSYEKYDIAYFGWIKFEVGSSLVDGIKKAVEVIPSIIRVLVTTTVRDNTFLGKHAPLVNQKSSEDEKIAEVVVTPESVVSATPATAEEIDKSIDAMVKEA